MTRKIEKGKKNCVRAEFVRHNSRRDRALVKRLKLAMGKVFTHVRGWDIETVSVLVASLNIGRALGVRALGETMPGKAGLKHRIKRVWRFLRNNKVDYFVWCRDLFAWAVGPRKRVLVAIDWTKFHSMETLVASVITRHGRAIPVYWDICSYFDLLRSRNAFEEGFIIALKSMVPPWVQIVLVMDRGFDRTALKKKLDRLGVGYVIRQRSKIKIVSKKFTGLIQNFKSGRGKPVDLGRCTFKYYEPRNAVEARVVVFRGQRQKERWILVTNQWDIPARTVVNIYARRFQIEESFRDIKNKRWGWKMRFSELSHKDRYLRLLLIAAIAMAFALLVGLEAEKKGYHMSFKANTETKRTHSLVRLGGALLAYSPGTAGRWLHKGLDLHGQDLVA